MTRAILTQAITMLMVLGSAMSDLLAAAPKKVGKKSAVKKPDEKPPVPQPQPNTLTEQEVRDGWLLLFDGASLDGWRTRGKVSVADGKLTLTGDADGAEAAFPVDFGAAECELSVEVVMLQGYDDDNVVGRVGDRSFPDLARSPGRAQLIRRAAAVEGSFQPNQPNSNGLGFASSGSPSGPMRVVFAVPKHTTMTVHSIKIRFLGAQPIFNGRDLTGWKEHPGKKSKWSVTSEGWLHVSDGPGDLQTEAAWADFVLSAEVRTNGDGLNSGCFFRCIAGQYQQGYEAQIQNGFKDGDRTKPADFGTGGIYRRAPARRVVADDKTWFVLTVLARGATMASWVNGVPVCVWTDERPADDNPRKGLRTAAGPISIQGHDPTTDINFRALRVLDLQPTTDKK